MTYVNALTALADPTRRAIFEAVHAGPKTVREIAAEQPISRPAVSQHLKVLMEAELLSVQPIGASRQYHLKHEGLEPLRQWLSQFWDDALLSFSAEIDRQNEVENT